MPSGITARFWKIPFHKKRRRSETNAPAAFLQVSAGTILPEKLQRQQCAFCKGGNCVDNRRPANHFTVGSIPPRRRTAAASRKPRTYQIIFESPHFIQCCHCGLYRLNFSLIKTLFNLFRREAVGKQLVHILRQIPERTGYAFQLVHIAGRAGVPRIKGNGTQRKIGGKRK